MVILTLLEVGKYSWILITSILLFISEWGLQATVYGKSEMINTICTYIYNIRHMVSFFLFCLYFILTEKNKIMWFIAFIGIINCTTRIVFRIGFWLNYWSNENQDSVFWVVLIMVVTLGILYYKLDGINTKRLDSR